jgi:hypothetical protein
MALKVRALAKKVKRVAVLFLSGPAREGSRGFAVAKEMDLRGRDYDSYQSVGRNRIKSGSLTLGPFENTFGSKKSMVFGFHPIEHAGSPG